MSEREIQPVEVSLQAISQQLAALPTALMSEVRTQEWSKNFSQKVKESVDAQAREAREAEETKRMKRAERRANIALFLSGVAALAAIIGVLTGGGGG